MQGLMDNSGYIELASVDINFELASLHSWSEVKDLTLQQLASVQARI